jgi:hypothetical protein
MIASISIQGCDDATNFYLEVSETEVALLQRLRDQSKKTSRVPCMPIFDFDVSNSLPKAASV